MKEKTLLTENHVPMKLKSSCVLI